MTYAEYLIESARDEYALFEELLASDFKETKLLKEGADEFQIRLLHEGAIETVWNAIKTAWSKLCKMFAELFKTIVEKIKKFIAAVKTKINKIKNNSSNKENSSIKISLPDENAFSEVETIIKSVVSYLEKDLIDIFKLLISDDVIDSDDPGDALLKMLGINCKFDDIDDYFKNNLIDKTEEFEVNNSNAGKYGNIIIDKFEIFQKLYDNFYDKFNNQANKINNMDSRNLAKFIDQLDESNAINLVNTAFSVYKAVLSKVGNNLSSVANKYGTLYLKATDDLIDFNEKYT